MVGHGEAKNTSVYQARMDTMYVNKHCNGRSVIGSTMNHPWKVYNMLFLGYFFNASMHWGVHPIERINFGIVEFQSEVAR